MYKKDGFANEFDGLYLSIFSDINYDKNGNIIKSITFTSDSIVEKLSESCSVAIYSKGSSMGCLVKYDPKGDLRWGWIASSFESFNVYDLDNKGGVYIGGENNYQNNSNKYCDIDPSPERSKDINEYHAVLLRYIETFRIKSDTIKNGVIYIPEQFVRWGESANISIIPNEGYEVDSVYTSRGDVLIKNADGSFSIPDVTDVVTVGATFKKSSSVLTYASDNFAVYPNPANDMLFVVSDYNWDKYIIFNATGTIVTEGLFTDKSISLKTLPNGVYSLQLLNKYNRKNIGFIKN